MSGRLPNATRFMRSESLRTVLYDIRDNILFAQQFVTGLDFREFEASRLHIYAATRAVEIISCAPTRSMRLA